MSSTSSSWHTIVDLFTQHKPSERQVFRSRVVSIKSISPTVKELVIDTSAAPVPFRFLPGQWIDVAVATKDYPNVAKQQLDENYDFEHEYDGSLQSHLALDLPTPLFRITGFSFTTDPLGNDVQNGIRLGIKYSDHPVVRLIHESVQPGHFLNTAGPGGSFVLPQLIKLQQNHAGRITFIAAGIGITPLVSMIQHLCSFNAAVKQHAAGVAGTDGVALDVKPEPIRLKLLYFAKTEDELCFREEIDNLSKQDEFFEARILATGNCSRQAQSDTTPEVSERASHAAIRKYVPSDDLFVQQGLFYLCGPKEFIDSTESLLEGELCIERSRVRYEKWW